MTNTSESPDKDEQAKPTPSRTRTSTRSKAEKSTQDSQDKEARPVTPRRTASKAVAAARSSGESASISTPSAPAAAEQSIPDQHTGETAAPAPRASRTTASASAPALSTVAPGTREATTPAQRLASPATPTPTQKVGGTGTATPTQRVAGPGTTSLPRTAHTTGTPVQRPASPTTPTPTQRVGGTGTATPTQRVAGPGTTPLPRTGYSTGTPVQRPASPATPIPTQRVGGTGTATPTQRAPGSSGMPFQRTGYSTGTPVQRPASYGTAVRPGSRPGGAPPAGNRTGGQAHPGIARPGTRTRTAVKRPAQRPQERRAPAVKEKPTGPVSIPPQIVVKDLADLLSATPNEIIRGLIKHSIFASINQVVDYDKAALVAQDLGFEPSQSVLTVAPAVQGKRALSANEAMIATRHEDNTIVIPPVVTIMGHVDHGKTSLLDTIRKTKVAAGEAGGITQYIGAYQVEIDGKKITFLDTPGHEAFTAMRARGAQVTHIAVIVVAADDGVMPQTREAIDHAQAAKVPIIIALNKIDKIDANPDRVKQQLADIGIVIEEYGGDVILVPVSARKGTGIDDLLEMILLVAEVQDIRANPNRPATGVIIEAKLEKSTGPTATVLIQQGTLKMGDNIVVGSLFSKVRAMFNDRGKRIQKAPPSTPVSILGLPEVPQAGDRLEVVADERKARQIATKIAEQRRSESMPLGQVSLDTLYMQMQEGTVKELDIVLKCDVQGSAEAIKNALTKVGEDNIKVRLIHEGIGNISETDVHLAAASDAIIIGFNVKADGAALREAQKEGVDIRYYNVIYKLTDDIQAALTGMLEPIFREVIEGHAEVRQIFKAGKNIVIAGCQVTDGKLTRSSQARILRNKVKVYDGKIASLRRGKDDVREVATGYECGIVLDDFTEFETGDIIETFAQERVKPGM